MKKELTININEYILLEFLRMLDYFLYDDVITEKIRELEKIINYRIYGNFFRSNHDIKILKENFILQYFYEYDI